MGPKKFIDIIVLKP